MGRTAFRGGSLSVSLTLPRYAAQTSYYLVTKFQLNVTHTLMNCLLTLLYQRWQQLPIVFHTGPSALCAGVRGGQSDPLAWRACYCLLASRQSPAGQFSPQLLWSWPLCNHRPSAAAWALPVDCSWLEWPDNWPADRLVKVWLVWLFHQDFLKRTTYHINWSQVYHLPHWLISSVPLTTLTDLKCTTYHINWSQVYHLPH